MTFSDTDVLRLSMPAVDYSRRHVLFTRLRWFDVQRQFSVSDEMVFS